MIEERTHLSALVEHGFELAEISFPRVDGLGCVRVGTNFYSVPVKPDQTVEVRLYPTYVEVREEGRCIARHERSYGRQQQVLDLEHYLDVLERKPGALAGSAALAQARAAGAFTAAHQQFWDRARARLGDGPGTRALIGVLLLHRRMPAAQVTAGITAALAAGSCSPDVVAIEARKHPGLPGLAGEGSWPALRPRPSRAAVVTLPRRQAELPADRRPAPSVAAYDQLLSAPPAAGQGPA